MRGSDSSGRAVGHQSEEVRGSNSSPGQVHFSKLLCVHPAPNGKLSLLTSGEIQVIDTTHDIQNRTSTFHDDDTYTDQDSVPSFSLQLTLLSSVTAMKLK
ncbi:hypothetical protein PoB_002477400 [Plakobranchus ocellatus]|uniref:Uncharacterized protein n=1 Tax=Plakobranchus ocellatus TaxID=259542 RepID=A0AAV3ZV12_9GAST|nr:hypothetical protein PoB_002477400 [Plakobranchus ocellatus]